MIEIENKGLFICLSDDVIFIHLIIKNNDGVTHEIFHLIVYFGFISVVKIIDNLNMILVQFFDCIISLFPILRLFLRAIFMVLVKL